MPRDQMDPDVQKAKEMATRSKHLWASMAT